MFQEQWKCPRAKHCSFNLHTDYTTDPGCQDHLAAFARVTGEAVIATLTTCPRYYQGLNGIQGPEGVIEAHNFSKENRTALTILYGDDVPNFIVDGMIILDGAIGAAAAEDKRRRDAEQARLDGQRKLWGIKHGNSSD